MAVSSILRHSLRWERDGVRGASLEHGDHLEEIDHMSKKIERKQSIIQAAIEVFSEKNFQNSTISEIAEKANVAEGTIYQYFKNKEDLFFSIPLEKSMEFSRELELHLKGIRGASNKVGKFIWYYLYFFTKNRGYGRTLMLEMRVSKNFVKTTAYDSFRPVTDAILEIIKEGQQEKVIRDDVSIYIIRQLILGVLEHMVTRWLLSEERYDLLEHCDEVNKLIFDGMGLTPSAAQTVRGVERLTTNLDQMK